MPKWILNITEKHVGVLLDARRAQAGRVPFLFLSRATPCRRFLASFVEFTLTKPDVEGFFWPEGLTTKTRWGDRYRIPCGFLKGRRIAREMDAAKNAACSEAVQFVSSELFDRRKTLGSKDQVFVADLYLRKGEVIAFEIRCFDGEFCTIRWREFGGVEILYDLPPDRRGGGHPLATLQRESLQVPKIMLQQLEVVLADSPHHFECIRKLVDPHSPRVP